jgi:hypothetical protein
MWDSLLWLYLINATLLINHEIDSAYWREWELFRLPGGITGFLLLHLPLVFLVLWGVVLLLRHSMQGIVLSVILGLAGLFAFAIHTYFIRKGRPEFRSWISIALLAASLVFSIAQMGLGLCAAWTV